MRFLSFLLCVVLILSFSVTAFADMALEGLPDVVGEPLPDESGEASSGNDYLDMILNNMQNDISDLEERTETLENDVSSLEEPSASAEPIDENLEENPDLGIDESLPTAVNVYALNPITPEDTTGLKSVLLSLIGDYDAIIVEYEYQGSNNYYNYLREVQPDYVWLCSAAIFLVIIYSTFRLGGALFRG